MAWDQKTIKQFSFFWVFGRVTKCGGFLRVLNFCFFRGFVWRLFLIFLCFLAILGGLKDPVAAGLAAESAGVAVRIVMELAPAQAPIASAEAARTAAGKHGLKRAEAVAAGAAAAGLAARSVAETEDLAEVARLAGTAAANFANRNGLSSEDTAAVAARAAATAAAELAFAGNMTVSEVHTLVRKVAVEAYQIAINRYEEESEPVAATTVKPFHLADEILQLICV